MHVSSFKAADSSKRCRTFKVAGLSSNMVYLVWAVFGGFLLHILLCNYLTVLLKPRHEDPVDFTTDIIKRNITPYGYPDWTLYSYPFHLTSHYGPEYQELLPKLVITKSYDEYFKMVGKVLKFSGSEAWIGHGGRERWWLARNKQYNRFKPFWVSKETFDISDRPYVSYLSNKKWPLLKVSLKLNCQAPVSPSP